MMNLYFLKTGKKSSISLNESTQGDMDKSFGNNELLINTFGKINFTSLNEGLSCMIDWALEVKYE